MDVDTISKVGMTVGTINNWNHIGPILRHIKENPSEEGRLAIKAFKRVAVITVLIIFLFCVPLFIYSLSFDYASALEYPNGATKYKTGRISLYENTFWYTANSQKYEFSFEDFGVDATYEPGENIYIYLDDSDNVIGISHRDAAEKKEFWKQIFPIMLSLFGTVFLIILNYLIARKTYGKHWYLYMEWYYEEMVE